MMFWSFQRCVWATASTDRAWISAVSATRVGTAPDATCVGASKTVMATAGVRTALATASAASTVTTAHSVSLQRKRIPNQNEEAHQRLLSSLADGCPNNCHGHGSCQRFRDGWRCSCMDGWKGEACDVAMESDCNNGVDDDGGT